MDTRSYLASELQNQYQDDPSAAAGGTDGTGAGPLGPDGLPTTVGATSRPRRPLFGLALSTGVPFLDGAWASINERLLVSKVFYFFFYSAFGSLFPLMGVYFKQLGMDAFQVGLLTGVRPLIEMISAPFWSGLADRFRKNKPMLLFSLFCWIVFTLSLAFIRPPASACVYFNETHHVLSTPYGEEMEVEENRRRRRSVKGPAGGLGSRSETSVGGLGRAADLSPSSLAGKGHFLLDADRNYYFYHHHDDDEQVNTDRGHHVQEHADVLAGARSEPLPTPLPITGLNRVVVVGERLRRQNSTNTRQQSSTILVPQEELITVIRPDHRPMELHRVRFTRRPPLESEGVGRTGNRAAGRQRREGDTDYPYEEEERRGAREGGEADLPGVPSIPRGDEGEEFDDRPIPTKNPKLRHKPPPNYVVGISPMTVEYTLNYDKAKHVAYVSPPFSSIVYKWDDVKEVFFLLILLTLLGEFFSSPAITLADTATINYLGENIDQYSNQRMFGSVGWGITMFFVGMALDNSVTFSDHPCGPHERERNYKVCFTIFSVLMACAWLVATRFEFDNTGSDLVREPSIRVPGAMTADDGSGTNGPGPRPIFNQAPPVNQPASEGGQKSYEFLDKWKSAVFAQRSRGLPPWFTMVKEFANVKCATFFLTAFFMGLGMGMVFAFLFWHLQDIGGTPTLFGYASVINHISEILAYFFSLNFIKQYGHKRVLCLGLVCNVVRFTYIAFLFNPWFVLPMELLQGVTHAACWATLCSYMNQISVSPQMRGSGQAILQTLHHGLGKALGAILGGLVINALGSRITFFLYALLTLLVLALFIYVHCYTRGVGLNFVDDHAIEDISLEDTGPLGPHGVPSAVTALQQHGPAGGAPGGQDQWGNDQWGDQGAQQQQQQQYSDPAAAWGDYN